MDGPNVAPGGSAVRGLPGSGPWMEAEEETEELEVLPNAPFTLGYHDIGSWSVPPMAFSSRKHAWLCHTRTS